MQFTVIVTTDPDVPEDDRIRLSFLIVDRLGAAARAMPGVTRVDVTIDDPPADAAV